MVKIEKRYQVFNREGIGWSSWFTFNTGSKNVTTLEPWQLDYKLKNEYRKVDDNGNITPIKIFYKVSSENKTKSKTKSK